MPGTKQVRDSVLQAIENTPVVRLQKVVSHSMGEVLVKLESYNPTGSYKDRMALAMIEGAEARGELRRVCASSSGQEEALGRRWRWSARSRDTASRPFPRMDLRTKSSG